MQLGFRWRRWKEPRLHTTKMEMESFYGRFRPDLRRCQVYVPISSQLRYWNQILHLLDDSRAIGLLESIALVGDPEFAIVDEATIWIFLIPLFLESRNQDLFHLRISCSKLHCNRKILSLMEKI